MVKQTARQPQVSLVLRLSPVSRETNDAKHSGRMFKKAFRQGRSERKAEAYAVGTLKP